MRNMFGPPLLVNPPFNGGHLPIRWAMRKRRENRTEHRRFLAPPKGVLCRGERACPAEAAVWNPHAIDSRRRCDEAW